MRTTRIIGHGSVALAFGMDWLPLVGQHPDRLARRLMWRHRATHSVLSGPDRSAVGLARLEGWKGEASLRSGAQLFASQHPRGTVAALVDLGDGSVCLVAAHDGVVLSRSDRIYHDPVLARGVIAELRLAYPRLSELPDPATPSAMIQSTDLARHSGPEAQLRPVPWRGWRPAAYWMPGAAVIALVAWRWMFDAAPAAAPRDDRQAWVQAQRHALDRHFVHGEAGTRALLRALQAQPARIAGWQLKLLSCRLADDSVWRCLGDYQRADRRADNRGLLRQAPAGWQLEFPTLDQARASWRLAIAAQPPDRVQPPSTRAQTRDWGSRVQAILPAFSTFRLDASRLIEPTVPRNADGRDMPRPADLPRYSMRGMRIEGPLRSAVLLMPVARHIGWRKAALSMDGRAHAGVRTSSMTLHLEGNLYETQDHTPP